MTGQPPTISPLDLLQAGLSLRTSDVAQLAKCSTMTVHRRFALAGVQPAQSGRGRAASLWRAEDVRALLTGGLDAAS